MTSTTEHRTAPSRPTSPPATQRETLMTATPSAAGSRSPVHWHRPLVVLTALMVGSTLVCIGGLIFDHRTLTGVPIWIKPLKFSLSIGIYALSWAWLIQQLHRHHRLAWWAGTVSAGFLLLEQVTIVGDVIRGTTSHFNVSTPFDAALWTVMAGSISIVWIATLIVSALLFKNPVGDRARNLTIRAASIIAVIGMALGFLMTLPTKAQTVHYDGIVGAHTVGGADGGAGLPFLGWSTTGGDLRIPHFIGMHALQTLPILLIALELTGRKIRRLRSVQVRTRLMIIAAAGYLAALTLITWQALRGQSIVHPDNTTTATAGGLLLLIFLSLPWATRGKPPADLASRPANLLTRPGRGR